MTQPPAVADDPSAASLRFAAEVTLALGATLNLQRTLGRALTMAVPRLAEVAFAGVTDGIRVLRMHVDETGRVEVEEDAVRPVRRSIPEASSGRTCTVGPLLELGVDEALARRAVELCGTLDWRCIPLVARGTTRGVLVLMAKADLQRTDSPHEQSMLLRLLAERASLAVDAALVYEQRNALATTLRSALLPPEPPDIPGVRLGARYRAALETADIGGDFYDFHRSRSGSWCLALGDVCGKGVDAAVLTGQVRQSLRVASVTHDDPARVLSVLNEAMLLAGSSNYVTVVWARLQPRPDGLDVVLADGGHPAPLVLRRDGSVEEVGPTGTLIGLLPEAKVVTTTVSLSAGDTLLLYSDGVTEARDPDGDLLGEARLHALLSDCVGMGSRSICERVEQAVMEHLRGRSHDDIAVLAVQPDLAGPR